MNRDLEAQLEEMGPAYRAVVARLRAGREAGEGVSGGIRRTRVWLLAASLVLAIGLAVVFGRTSRTCPASHTCLPSPRDYTMSVAEMIKSQNRDGSWQNDFLTRQNAAALKLSDLPEARVAYKKAMRNLRIKGVL